MLRDLRVARDIRGVEATRVNRQADQLLRRNEDRFVPFFDRNERPELRAGFGKGTVSTPGAALQAVSRTIEETRRVIPSLEQIRERFQLQSIEDKIANRKDDSDRTALESRRVVRKIPEPSAQARHFLNAVNEAAQASQDRLEGIDREAETRATAVINGESIAFGIPRTPNRINLFA